MGTRPQGRTVYCERHGESGEGPTPRRNRAFLFYTAVGTICLDRGEGPFANSTHIRAAPPVLVNYFSP